jgi:ubiquinone biosynthesis protein UbiJ
LQAEGFLQAVDEVRDAVERLEKRLALLEQRRTS